MTRPFYVQLCCHLVDKIHHFLENSKQGIRYVKIQTDSAGGHGGGRSGKGMQMSLNEINQYATKYAEVVATDTPNF